MSAAEAEAAAERVAELLSAAPEYRSCKRLVPYAELPGELSLRMFVARAQRDGKHLLWPRVVAAGGLDFAHAPCVDALRRSGSGALEPPAGATPEQLGPDVLVLVPGVAFDLRGGRLGRGGGHWDRALTAPLGAIVLGVGYEFQIVERVPSEPHDRRVEGLVTEVSIRRFTSP